MRPNRAAEQVVAGEIGGVLHDGDGASFGGLIGVRAGAISDGLVWAHPGRVGE